MDKMLGEVTNIEEVKEKDLVWHEGAYVPVRGVSFYDDDPTAVRVDFLDGRTLIGAKGEQVIRGHYFLVARRLD